MRKILLAFFFLAPLALAQQDQCASLESGVEAEVKRAPLATDDVGVFRTIGDRTLTALHDCPQSARLWYWAARSAEVLEHPTNGKAFAAEGGLQGIVSEALSHCPSSAPVDTVAARVQGSSALARKALTLDPAYEPARRALAELLAKEDAVTEALQLTESPHSGPMRLARARVLLAAKRPADAITEARKVAIPGDPDELSPSSEMYSEKQEILGFALLDLHKTTEAHKALRAAAAAGSVAAQAYLAK